MNADRTRIILSAFICVHRRPLINRAEAYGSPGPPVDRPASSPGEQVKPAQKIFEPPMNDKRRTNQNPVGVRLPSSAANHQQRGGVGRPVARGADWQSGPASDRHAPPPVKQGNAAPETLEPPTNADKRHRTRIFPSAFIGVHRRPIINTPETQCGSPFWGAVWQPGPPVDGSASSPGERVMPAQKTFEPPMNADQRGSTKNPIGVRLPSSAANHRQGRCMWQPGPAPGPLTSPRQREGICR